MGKNYNNNNNSNNGNQKKKTGATFGLDKNGNPYVSGWNLRKQDGFSSFFCRPYKGTKKSKSNNGREWHNWFVTIKNGFNKVNTSGLYDPVRQMVIVKEYGIVLNPKARNGGYCGTFTKRN